MRLSQRSAENMLAVALRSCSSCSYRLQGAGPDSRLVVDSSFVVVLLMLAPRSLTILPLQLPGRLLVGHVERSQVAQSDSNARRMLQAEVVVTGPARLAVAVGLHTVLALLQLPHSAPASRSMCSFQGYLMQHISPRCRSSLKAHRWDQLVSLVAEASLSRLSL